LKTYIITILDESSPAHDQSIAAAKRCQDSLKQYGLSGYELFPAFTPESPVVKEKLQDTQFMRGFHKDSKYSRMERCVAAHMSHRTLWEECSVGDTDYLILEHDAVMTNPIPDYLKFDFIMNVGRPSYGKFHLSSRTGNQPLFSKKYFPGAHAYMMSPSGARRVIRESFGIGGPTDTFLDIRRFSFLEEYNPWFFRADDRFSSIQKERGCAAKHGLHKDYQRL
jgi:GR25 family glycosyltransferase involved in LPS biosynthesis